MALTFSTSDSNNELVLKLGGQLDALSAPELLPTIDTIVAEKRPVIVVDLSDLELIDSSGVAAPAARAIAQISEPSSGRKQRFASFKSVSSLTTMSLSFCEARMNAKTPAFSLAFETKNAMLNTTIRALCRLAPIWCKFLKNSDFPAQRRQVTGPAFCVRMSCYKWAPGVAGAIKDGAGEQYGEATDCTRYSHPGVAGGLPAGRYPAQRGTTAGGQESAYRAGLCRLHPGAV